MKKSITAVVCALLSTLAVHAQIGLYASAQLSYNSQYSQQYAGYGNAYGYAGGSISTTPTRTTSVHTSRTVYINGIRQDNTQQINPQGQGQQQSNNWLHYHEIPKYDSYQYWNGSAMVVSKTQIGTTTLSCHKRQCYPY
jgi:hypothetical protein